jgi:hypothetical protein
MAPGLDRYLLEPFVFQELAEGSSRVLDRQTKIVPQVTKGCDTQRARGQEQKLSDGFGALDG